MNSDYQICLIRSEEEARAIETALRTAVLSVVEVINDISRSRFQDCQRKVTEKEKENAQLKVELYKAEEELAFLRQLVGSQQKQQSEEGSVRCNASIDAHVPDSRWSVEIEDGVVNEASSTPQSSEEQSKNSREPLSAAEKQRRYRARRDANPERRANYLEWERRKWKRDRELGKKKLVHECSVSEQRTIRGRWKLAKAKSRAKDATGILSPLSVSPEYHQLHPHEADDSIDNQFEFRTGEATALPQDSAAGASERHGHNGPVFTPSGFSENHTDMMNSLVVKEEPPNTDTVYIKFEVKEENACTDQEGSSPSCVLERETQEKSRFTHFRDGALGTRSRLSYRGARLTEDRRLSSVSRVKKRIDDRERQRRYRERIHSDPEKLQAYLEKDRRRYLKKRKSICELPEQIQRQKRAMWREAARRCRARKRNTPLAQWTEPL
ncbi:uncharacterized protein LOC134082795 isoform X1 [Sardina pilchardus]|uniref:uncharacterized protein LOC134082795 isoform X1 n=1 Tax=Sardina pilchardus TaxID=27697 RepID=UPI002E149616